MSTSIGSILTGVATGVVLGAVPILRDINEIRWRKQFRKQIKDAIAAKKLEYTDLQHIAERWSQDRKAVLQSLRVILSEALAGEEPKLAESIELIRELLKGHERAEPYSELPENISLQLAALAKSGEQNPPLVEQLANSLSELYSSNQRQLLKQSRYTVAGVFIGIVGIVVGVISWIR